MSIDIHPTTARAARAVETAGDVEEAVADFLGIPDDDVNVLRFTASQISLIVCAGDVNSLIMAINQGDTAFAGTPLASARVVGVRWDQPCAGSVLSSFQEASVSIVASSDASSGDNNNNVERPPNTSLFSSTDVTSIYLYVQAYFSPDAERRDYQYISPRSAASSLAHCSTAAIALAGALLLFSL